MLHFSWLKSNLSTKARAGGFVAVRVKLLSSILCHFRKTLFLILSSFLRKYRVTKTPPDGELFLFFIDTGTHVTFNVMYKNLFKKPLNQFITSDS